MGDLTKARACIIAVHGNVLDKIGFNIAERANRSEELRLERTLTALTTLEHKDDTRYRKEKQNLQSQLEKLQKSQLDRRREKIKVSQSVGDNLDKFNANSHHNQRRMTSGALYEHRFRFGDVTYENTYSDDFIEFSVPERNSKFVPDDVDDQRTECAAINVRSGNDCTSETEALYFPDIAKQNHKIDAITRALGSVNDLSLNPLGTLRRQLTEPNLGSITHYSRGSVSQLPQRPSSAHALPSLPSSPLPMCHKSEASEYQTSRHNAVDTATNSRSRREEIDLDEYAQFRKDSIQISAVNHQIRSQTNQKVLPVTRAHLKAPTTRRCRNIPKQFSITRRRSLEPDMMREESAGTTYMNIIRDNSDVPNIEENKKHRLTPRSYFQKYGVPIERVQLLQILLEEREILKQRIKIFLAKRNP